MATAIVIPARLGSTRLKNKLLLDRTGKPLIAHTCESVLATGMRPIYVVTDSQAIANAVASYDVSVIMTGDHPSGTARVAWAVAHRIPPRYDKIINVQGDEPDVNGACLSILHSCLSHAEIATVATPINDIVDMYNQSVVKVVTAVNNLALYFSRSCIPFLQPGVSPPYGLRHIGIYAYRREFLWLVHHHPDVYNSSAFSCRENLEQLSWLYMGHKVFVVTVDSDCRSIDTGDDYERFCARIATRGAGTAGESS